MKTFQKAIFACLVFSIMTTSIFANTNPKSPNSSKDNLRKEVFELVKNPLLGEYDYIEAELSFVITPDNEIIVLRVDSDHAKMNDFFKSRLNYQKIQTEGVIKNTLYRMKVRFELE